MYATKAHVAYVVFFAMSQRARPRSCDALSLFELLLQCILCPASRSNAAKSAHSVPQIQVQYMPFIIVCPITHLHCVFVKRTSFSCHPERVTLKGWECLVGFVFYALQFYYFPVCYFVTTIN